MPFLEILNGPEAGTRFDMEHETIFIGRDSNNHCILSDRTVSRKHAVINKVGNQYSVSDLQSLKGILINGKKVQETHLENGDEITLGAVRLRFYEGEGSYNTPLVLIRPQRSYVGILLGILFSLILLGSVGFYVQRWGLHFPPSIEKNLSIDSEESLKEHYEEGLRYFNEDRDFESAKAEWQLVLDLDLERKSHYSRKILKLLKNTR